MAQSLKEAEKPSQLDAVEDNDGDRTLYDGDKPESDTGYKTDLEAGDAGESGEQTRVGTSNGEEESDPNVVDWDGPDDPENPMNWPDSKKWMNVTVLSLLTIVTPLGSSMFAPGIPDIMVQFHTTSSTVATFLLSVYILGFAFGPLVIAPLSEILGRRPLYFWGNVLFTLFTVGTALSNGIPMLMVFRLLMGLAGAVPVTIGSGSIADTMPVEKRGRAMAAWALGPLLGPCIGPVAGGYLIQATSWRWVYWLIVIMGGLLVPFSFIMLKETFAPVILEKKAAALRKKTGNPDLHSKLAGRLSPAEQFKFAIVRPMKLLVTTPIVTLMSLYIAIAYGILYLMITTFSFVYAEKYHFSEGTSGLSYVPAGIGMMIGVIGFGQLSDIMVQKAQAQGSKLRPELRLMPTFVVPAAMTLPIGLFIYGWTTNYGVHWIVPMIGVCIFTAGLMGVMMSIQNYLLDAYPVYAASVTAALTVLRSLLGALLPLGGLQMYDALGLGWGNSLLAFVALAMVPIPLCFYLYGERIRTKFSPKL